MVYVHLEHVGVCSNWSVSAIFVDVEWCVSMQLWLLEVVWLDVWWHLVGSCRAFHVSSRWYICLVLWCGLQHCFFPCYGTFEGHVVAWLRHCTTSWKVAGSIPEEVRFFNWCNPSCLTMALELTQPLTEMSTSNLTGGKGRPVRKADNLIAISEPIV
jgi:hypothetical protein